MANVYILFMISLVLSCCPSQALETLGSVQIIYHHGHREADPNPEAQIGLLTDEGKRLMYDLGLEIRKRYNGFFREEFDAAETAFLSSDLDRTLQSASLVAYGLYREYNLAATWSGEENILYEPIPVRSIPKKYDNILQLSKSCPKHERLTSACANNFLTNFIGNNRKFLETYSEKTGDSLLLDESHKAGKRLDKFAHFFEHVLLNHTNKRPVESWAKEILTNDRLLRFSLDLANCYLDTEEKQKLYVGPLVQKLLQEFEVVPSKKITLYSAHDRTLFSLMKTLGIWKGSEMPAHGAHLIMEVFLPLAAIDSGSYCKFWYADGKSTNAQLLEIPNCGRPCHLNKFKELFANVISVEPDKDCEIPSPASQITIQNVTNTDEPSNAKMARKNLPARKFNGISTKFQAIGPENPHLLHLKAIKPDSAEVSSGALSLFGIMLLLAFVGMTAGFLYLFRKRSSYTQI